MAEPLSGNIATADPTQTALTQALTTEMVDLLARYQQWLKAQGGANLNQLKALRGGNITIAQSGGVFTITLTPTGPVPNPNPYA